VGPIEDSDSLASKIKGQSIFGQTGGEFSSVMYTLRTSAYDPHWLDTLLRSEEVL